MVLKLVYSVTPTRICRSYKSRCNGLQASGWKKNCCEVYDR